MHLIHNSSASFHRTLFVVHGHKVKGKPTVVLVFSGSGAGAFWPDGRGAEAQVKLYGVVVAYWQFDLPGSEPNATGEVVLRDEAIKCIGKRDSLAWLRLLSDYTRFQVYVCDSL